MNGTAREQSGKVRGATNSEKPTGVLTVLGFAMITWAGAALLLFLTLSVRGNTLQRNGNWVATKAGFEEPLVGAKPYVTGTQALAQNCLSLTAWNGCQEVLYRKSVVPEEIEFRMLLTSQDSYLVVIFNKDAKGFDGIRLSPSPKKPSMLLSALDSGQFTRKRPLNLNVAVGAWQSVRLRFAQEELTLEIDGKETALAVHRADGPTGVGFRAGMNEALVDDVGIRELNVDPPFRETFSGRWPWEDWLRLTEALTVLELLLVLVFLRFFSLGRIFGMATSVHLCAIACLLVLLPFTFFVLARRYPSFLEGMPFPSLARFGKYAQQRFREIDGNCAEPSDPSVRKVFVTGSSQTFGMGARIRAEGCVPALERLLNGEGDGRSRYKCVNGAVQGTHANFIALLFEEHAAPCKPAIAVVNLGYNDSCEKTPLDEYGGYLARIAKTAKAANIKLILVQEPRNDEDSTNLLPVYDVMARVAAEEGVPLVNASAFFQSHFDDGFIWWDRVHPTSYGHQLLAECLCPFVKKAAQD